MSVRKSCYNCKHYKKGVCGYEKYSGVACVTENMDFWELSDDAKVDVLHDAEPEHDAEQEKEYSESPEKCCGKCLFYLSGYCNNPSLREKWETSENDYCTSFIHKSRRKVGQMQSVFIEQIKDKCRLFDRLMSENINEVVDLITQLDYDEDINNSVDMVSKCFHVDRELIMSLVIDCKKNKSNCKPLAYQIFMLLNKLEKDKPEHDAVSHPSHYTSGGIECIDCIKAALGENFMGFLIGNVIKYCYRYRNKNGVEDLRESMKYLEWAIQELGDEE